jgi:hypothetical protein
MCTRPRARRADPQRRGPGHARCVTLGACIAALGLSCAHPAAARELWASDDTSYRLSLDSAFKATGLITRAPDDPLLFPERTSATGLLRLRFSLNATLGEHVDTQVSYEQRMRATSDPTGLAGSGLLPTNAPPPFRIVTIEQALLDQPHVLYLHELDRAYVALHFAPLELTIGRQALGLGRGVLFSAVDVFAPFTPLEVDREWRRGVDAVHAEWSFAEHFSCDVIGAADHGADAIKASDFAAAYDKIVLGDPRDAKLDPKEKARVAVHEAGHALIAHARRPRPPRNARGRRGARASGASHPQASSPPRAAG